MERFLLVIAVVIKAACGGSGSWTANISQSVSALRGTCVVIPCSYTHPDTGPGTIRSRKGYWYTDEKEPKTVFRTETKDIHPDYRGRTHLLGNISAGNCSLMVDNVRETDSQSMYFRIHVEGLDNYSYLKHKVSISVQAAPSLEASRNLTEGTVTFSCSVLYGCPSVPLNLTWSHEGNVTGGDASRDGQQTLVSRLTFRPTASMARGPITCTAMSGDRKIAEASKELNTDLVWAVEVPEAVDALRGSCLVIPCKFMCPDFWIPSNTTVGLWLELSDASFVYHPNASKVAGKYKGRTQLVGDLKKGNCSLKIRHIQNNDNGPFYFRVQMTRYNFSFAKSKVHVRVIDVPGDPVLNVTEVVQVGKNVSATCSVNHSCPSNLPSLTWNRNGLVVVESRWLDGGQWTATSVLTFVPEVSDNRKHLECTADYKLQNKFRSLKVLDVRYPPEIKPNSACAVGNAEVTCRFYVDSNPASEVEFSVVPRGSCDVKNVTNGSVTTISLRGEKCTTATVALNASNSEGRAALSLNVGRPDVWTSVYTYAAVAVACLLIVLAAVCFCACRKGEKRDQSSKGAKETYANFEGWEKRRRSEYSEDIYENM
ncbi:sialic acid-binding Ig-like lectin 6 [Arapaima gigas]